MVDPATETPRIQLLVGELQTLILDEFEKLAFRWLRGSKGKAWIFELETTRKKGGKRRKLSIMEIEDYFEFTPEDWQSIWYPVCFTLDPLFWNPDGPCRLQYQELRMCSLAILVRFIIILTTGKVKKRELTVSGRLKVLDCTETGKEGSGRAWPPLTPRASRPQGTTAWEMESPTWDEHVRCPGYGAFWARLKGHRDGTGADVGRVPGAGNEDPEVDLEDDDDEIITGVTTGEKIGFGEETERDGSTVVKEIGKDNTEDERTPAAVVGHGSKRDNKVGGLDGVEDKQPKVDGVSKIKSVKKMSGMENPNVRTDQSFQPGKPKTVESKDVIVVDDTDGGDNFRGRRLRRKKSDDGEDAIGLELQVYEASATDSETDEDERGVPNVPMEIGAEFHSGHGKGLVTLEELAELDVLAMEDRQLNEKIRDLISLAELPVDIGRQVHIGGHVWWGIRLMVIDLDILQIRQ